MQGFVRELEREGTRRIRVGDDSRGSVLQEPIAGRSPSVGLTDGLQGKLCVDLSGIERLDRDRAGHALVDASDFCGPRVFRSRSVTPQNQPEQRTTPHHSNSLRQLVCRAAPEAAP